MSQLKHLYEEDQQDRLNFNWDDKKHPEYQEKLQELIQKDERRRKRVLRLYTQQKIKTAQDFYYAALILQHGNSPNDFKIANEFAKKAMIAGLEKAKWLYAATLDRWLLSRGKPQKFGTQFKKEGGRWKLIKPIDPTISDKERAKYGLPPLSKALQKFKEKYSL